jgi:hypothetical protein
MNQLGSTVRSAAGVLANGARSAPLTRAVFQAMLARSGSSWTECRCGEVIQARARTVAATNSTQSASHHMRLRRLRLHSRTARSAFHTTARVYARSDASTIEYARMPTREELYPAPSDDPFARLRVPLSPDNFTVEGHAPETRDEPLAAPEILVIAADPDNVAPAALTEVEGIGIDGVELNFARFEQEEDDNSPSMITDFWKGMMDEIFGPEDGKKSKGA